MVANQSGTFSKSPTLLSYPKVLPFAEVPELKGVFCYVIEKYPLDGLSVIISRYKDSSDVPMVSYTMGDWNGRKIDMHKKSTLHDLAEEFMAVYSEKMLGLMQKINLQQAQYYISYYNKGMVLTDVRTHLNKMLGPGATEQLFSVVMPTQKQLSKPTILDDDTITKINGRLKPYNVGVIFKPSAFKTITRGKELQPMYGIIG